MSLPSISTTLSAIGFAALTGIALAPLTAHVPALLTIAAQIPFKKISLCTAVFACTSCITWFVSLGIIHEICTQLIAKPAEQKYIERFGKESADDEDLGYAYEGAGFAAIQYSAAASVLIGASLTYQFAQRCL